MKHKLVETVLNDFGYGETIGEEALYDGFEEYCRQRSTTPAKVPFTDEAVGAFLEWLLTAQAGLAECGGDERQLDGGEAAGYESPDYSFSGTDSQEDEDEDGEEDGVAENMDVDAPAGSGRKRRGRQGAASAAVAYGSDSGADLEVLEATEGGEPGWGYADASPLTATAAEAEVIEESSDEEAAPRLPPSTTRRRSSAAAAEAAVGGRQSQGAAARGASGIESFFQRVPRGVASNAALAGPRPSERQVLGAQAMRPAAAEEQQLDLLDFANLKVFGNAAFRPQQRQIVEAALSGKDCFVLMPTGGGKSLTYQLPAVLSKGLTVVVTPLLSLMQDQVQALTLLASGGVPTTYLSSQQTVTESKAVFLELGKARPTVKLLYVTPEQLVRGERLKAALGALHSRGLLARIVIDEAHCVSAWGHDFRPDYQQLGPVRSSHFRGVPMMALTATATPKVRQDVLSTLHMPCPRQFQVSFYRSNLRFSVIKKEYGRSAETGLEEYLESMLLFIQNHRDGSGIVYCLSRDNTETVAAQIREQTDVSAAHYHAGMTPKQRMQVQNDWRTGRCKVVVATIAFGMGVDKADVRWVIHYTLSKSMEGYYQEAGRAGRDGAPAECVLYYAKRDVPRIVQLLHLGARRNKSQFQRELDLLKQVQAYCEDDQRCRHAQLLSYFGEQWQQGRCGGQCDVCSKPHPSQQGGGSKLAGAAAGAAAPAGFQSAASLLSGQGGSSGGGQRLHAAGSHRALKAQQAAVAAGGWRTKKGKENPAAAAAGPPVFVTASTLAKQQQRGPAAAGGKKGGKAAAPSHQKNALDLLFGSKVK
ncbi:hypothetical protein D9Q98_007855 [Chlorella vulgaris]|uniref:ATP-dependent DNA helicase n=1 Tax=Chlorella vulgaris TaxID=3077 RepID=A0A9D4YU28_CHLVU|nr:hypothetical protein D9Q98_007855 [Chlorella vulgaris]